MVGGQGTAGACLSFYATKNLTCGEGGALVTDDADLAAFARAFRLHGMSKDAWHRFSDNGYVHYDVEAPGFGRGGVLELLHRVGDDPHDALYPGGERFELNGLLARRVFDRGALLPRRLLELGCSLGGRLRQRLTVLGRHPVDLRRLVGACTLLQSRNVALGNGSS